ncbi:heterokaryon incompatibility protein-domain-containing protein [Triangularia verruculosa]|uniref:Heterokaryon incompatibility protein-domain-containing protein n=1 Tax=Triangularia verruculosa TaxID=2587418 RepID=A0AAN7ARE2_9PEZI|nr:heterokaryon incompatibility protein-domain-containing protein [Triangularia verruculosa]
MSKLSNSYIFDYNNVRLPNPTCYIRLLHLHPTNVSVPNGSSPAPLRCSISVCSLNQPVPYHAISYTWGSPDDKHHYLEVCNHESEPPQRLYITSSLADALHHLRELAAGSVTTLWIDQICINQADNDSDEKSKQVGIMHRIYSSAEQVRVWLGPAADESDEVMEMWEEVGKKCEEEVNLASYFASNLAAIQTLIDHANNRTPNDPVTQRIQRYMDWAAPRMKPHLNAMTVMFKRPWFRRVWVIQEFALARNTVLICGLKVTAAQYPAWVLNMYGYCRQRIWPGSMTDEDFEVCNALRNQPFDTLFTIKKRRQDHNDAVQQGRVRTDRNSSPPAGPGAGDYLFDLLVKTSSGQRMEATDLRDRVYALFGIAVDREKLERLGLTPDYRDCDFEMVLLLTARATMLRGEVQMLSFSQFPKDHIVPSWVPEWRPDMATPFFHYSNRSLGRLPPMFTASANSLPAVTETDDTAIIGVRGCRIDIVEDTADPWEQTEWDVSNNSCYLAFLKQVQSLCDRSAIKGHQIYASETRRAEAIWRVPVADCELATNGLSRASVEKSGQVYAYCLESYELFELHSKWDPEVAARHEELRPGNVYCTFLGRTGNRRPFITEKGYVGLGPVSTETGDMVVAFAGAPLTYLVRPTTRDGHFKFLGDSYCDGVMDGEAWDETKAETFFLV